MILITPKANDTRVSGLEYIRTLVNISHWWTGAPVQEHLEYAPITVAHNVRWRLVA